MVQSMAAVSSGNEKFVRPWPGLLRFNSTEKRMTGKREKRATGEAKVNQLRRGSPLDLLDCCLGQDLLT